MSHWFAAISIPRTTQFIPDQLTEKEGTSTWLYFGVVFFLGILSIILFLRVKNKQVNAKKLKMYERERDMLFNNAPCGYHSIDENGFLVNVNRTLLLWLGYEREELIGKVKFTDLIAGESESTAEKLALFGKGSSAIDISLIRKNGELFHITLSVVNADQLTDNTSGRLFSSIDNTRCHEALERVRTLDLELDAFSYSISHDLRAPLRSIEGYSRILQEDYVERLDEEGRRVLNVVMSNARRMGKLIDDLLEFGRLGRQNLSPSNVNMASIARGVVQDLRQQEPARSIEVRVEELITAHADADMMKQVWFSLIENAFKYTGKKDAALIEITSFKIDDHEICYQIKDNGVGFDMRYAGKLFGVFQRLHKIQDFSGTGVGLAIVKRIVTRHGGRVWAEAALNQGAIFCFTLPTTENENG